MQEPTNTSTCVTTLELVFQHMMMLVEGLEGDTGWISWSTT